MSTQQQPDKNTEPDFEKEIVRYLKNHPDFFENHIELLADLILQVAPHVDIWIIQLSKYQGWVDAGRAAIGSPAR